MRATRGLAQDGQNFIRGGTRLPCQTAGAVSIVLLTFDVFGTVLDWRRGLREALGVRLSDDGFDRIVDRQGELEQQGFRPYAEIVAQSLVEEVGLPAEEAARIGAAAGTWPLFPDSAAALRRLRSIAPCAAITNSDLARESTLAPGSVGPGGRRPLAALRPHPVDVVHLAGEGVNVMELR